jgi:hypothetical protein
MRRLTIFLGMLRRDGDLEFCSVVPSIPSSLAPAVQWSAGKELAAALRANVTAAFWEGIKEEVRA